MSTIRKLGPCGFGGGVPVRDMNVAGVARISRIGVRHGASIDALIVHYERGGRIESTDVWGGQGGSLTEFTASAVGLSRQPHWHKSRDHQTADVIIVPPTEYITSVSGHIAPWGSAWQVRSLKLVTDSGTTYGPFGTQEGVPFELPVVVGRIVGFHARAGSMLEAIGLYVNDPMGHVWSSAEPIIRKVGPCGSGSGVPVKDMDVTGITRIVKIGIRHGNSIDALIVSYERNRRVESTERWGGEGGRLSEINLQPAEYITNVRGHIAPGPGNTLQVRSLTVETNSNTYGPYGTQEGVPFELPAVGGRIIGFHARTGLMVEAIGVYVKAGGTDYTTGTAGTWTPSDVSFWDRPVSGA